MNYTERVEGYQIRDVVYFGKPPKDAPELYDIVKWNTHDKPFEAIDGTTGERITVTESCYTVGFLEWNRREPCFEFKSCGLRWLEENPPKEVIDMVLKFAEEKGKELEAEDD